MEFLFHAYAHESCPEEVMLRRWLLLNPIACFLANIGMKLRALQVTEIWDDAEAKFRRE